MYLQAVGVPGASLPLSYGRQIGFAAAERRQVLHQRWYHHHVLQQQQRGWSHLRTRRDTNAWFHTVHADDAGFRQVYLTFQWLVNTRWSKKVTHCNAAGNFVSC